MLPMKNKITLTLLLLLGGSLLTNKAFPEMDRPVGYPEFNWDTVPIYIHFGTSEGFTDEDIQFIASHSNLVCMEKMQGHIPHGSVEAGIAHDARRMKEVNPDIKVLFYWNTFLDYPNYEAHEVYQNHPEWWLRTRDSSLDKKQGRIKRYDLSKPEVREWWTDVVEKAVVDGPCDGVFMDAFPQIASQGNIKLWGQKKYDAIQKGLIKTIELTRKKIGADNLIMYNGIRNTDNIEFGMEYVELTDISAIEHFGHFYSTSPDSMARDIEAMIEAGKQGKIVVMKAWPGFDWLDKGIENVPHKELLNRARKNLEFPLACFLVAAQPYSYFAYTWGYRKGHGSLDWYPEFDKPLGKPLGDAKKDGYQYSREFQHCRVTVNLKTKQASIVWNP